MAIERWGSLSVADHNDTTALTANVLLYDRLVMPIYTEARDRNEREYWEQKGWNPDLQAQRHEQLGDLIIECAWDETRRQSYTERYQAAAQINDEINGEMITRWLLTENHEETPLPKGVSHADVFVAYHSEAETQQEIPYQKIDEAILSDETQLAILIAHELNIPDIKEPEIALREAIGLSRESDFRKKREDLYDFQMTCLSRGMKPKAIVEELTDRNRELAEYIRKQKIPVYKKTGFMLASVALGVVGGAFIHPLAAVGGLLSVWQFAAFDAVPGLEVPNRLRPVAGFYDVEEKMGVGLGGIKEM